MPPSRRQFLATSAATSGLLAGCQLLDDGAGTPTSTPVDVPTETHSPTDATTPTSEQTAEPSGPARRTRRQTGEGPLAVVGATTAYVAVADTVRAYRFVDGTEAWHRSPGRVAALRFAGGTLFSLTADGVVRMHETDGTARWSADLDAAGRSVARTGGTLLALDSDGTVLAFDASTGSSLWRRRLDGTPVGLTAGTRQAYVATDSPARLHALALADGSRHWTVQPGETVTAPPTVANGQVLVGVEFPHYDPDEGTRTPTPMPTDSPTAGGAVSYAPDGTEQWVADVPGTPAWFVETDTGPLLGFRGFVFEFLQKVPQVAGLALDGGERWRREQVPFRRRAAVTRGVALHVDPAAPEVRVDDESVRRGQTALRTDGSEALWTLETGAGTAAAAGDVFVTVEDDAVRARGALSGRERWAVELG